MPQIYRVERVIDGDTLVATKEGAAFVRSPEDQFLSRKQREAKLGAFTIRLAKIDADELTQPNGPNSKAELKRLLPMNSRFTFAERTPATHDRYGRTIAELVDERGLIVNERMVSSGNAVAYQHYLKSRDGRFLTSYDANYVELENQARSRKRGRWSDPNSPPQNPEDYRRQHNRGWHKPTHARPPVMDYNMLNQ